ncbi:hypothetical protein DVR12_19665 [Chitinophaga silvatica]|uniref:Uncharacterized protein n=1 Tax=Chitinophaga silvatica TaxID=2282649 RepID=A0A3E1Y5D5_9BACT|nr:hypothetical protein [Chitinophaga silvatica]RFS19950.1 hypothetical protein DVR12_19665 [Chitinophaga silvatica]
MKTQKTLSSEVYIKNLHSYNPITKLPVTEFAAGSDIHLKWESNGKSFKVYCGSKNLVGSSEINSIKINPKIVTNSTLVVEATLGNQKSYASITITINNPSLKPSKVDTSNDEKISGHLWVQGESKIKDAFIGTLTTINKVSMFQNGMEIAKGKKIEETKLVVKTDGFLMVYIEPPIADTFSHSFAVGEIYTAGKWFKAMGGNAYSYNSKGSMNMTNPNTFIVPIKANSDCRYYCYNHFGNQVDSTVYFYWFPLGFDQAPTSEPISKHNFPSSRPKETNPKALITERMDKALEIVSLLEKATDKIFDNEIKEELASQLLKL